MISKHEDIINISVPLISWFEPMISDIMNKLLSWWYDFITHNIIDSCCFGAVFAALFRFCTLGFRCPNALPLSLAGSVSWTSPQEQPPSRSWSSILQHSTAAGFSTSRTHRCQPFVLRGKALHWVTCFCSCRKNTLIQLKISLRETNQTKAIDSTSNSWSINPVAYPLPLAAMFHTEDSLHRSD